MNILVIPSWYNSPSNIILGSFFKEQALALKNDGNNVVMAYCETVGVRGFSTHHLYKITKQDEDGLLTYRYYVPSYGCDRFHKKFERTAIAYDRLLKRVLSEHKIDIIHVHSYDPAGTSITKLRNRYGIPVVYTEHYSNVLGELDSYHKKALEETINYSNAVLAVSHSLRDSMVKRFKREDVWVVSNILSPLFTFKPRINHSVFRFVSVGSLVEGKGHQLTIKAFHEAFCHNEKVELMIVGQGNYKNELAGLIKEFGEENRIKLTGTLPREKVAELMQESDAFVLPSFKETFGVSYIEAMACGLPVIGTRNGGFDEIFNEDNRFGYIIDVGDEEALANALEQVYCSIDNYDSKFISETTIQLYGADSFIKHVNEVYQSVLKKR